MEFLPAPETAAEQLATFRKLPEGRAKVPDVYALDVSWPGILGENLLDLRAYVPEQEIQAHFPELIANNTVNGRLVALPANLNEGMLFYRMDLLRKYGYRAPPKTWEKLEVMARRIQSGERANGNKDFWGFIWEGAPSEGSDVQRTGMAGAGGRYQIGAWLKIVDPLTGQPAVKNLFYPSKAGATMRYSSRSHTVPNRSLPGHEHQGAAAPGVKLLACHTATEEQARSLIVHSSLTQRPEEIVDFDTLIWPHSIL